MPAGSPGCGAILLSLRRVLGAQAPIAALVSLGMAAEYRRRDDAAGVELVHADPHARPFADAAFDVRFHFGGAHRFDEPARALAGFVRMIQPGG